MSNQFKVQYGETYARALALQGQLEAGLQKMEAEYEQIQSMLTEVDGATNAALMSAMEKNRVKARITGETLHKLLRFLNNSTQHVEEEEKVLASVYKAGGGL
jgi:hypothetical protein